MPTAKMQSEEHEHSENDVELCKECAELMKTAAEKCRSLSDQSTSPMCKGGLSTAAFVCEGLAKSMEKCIEAMTKNRGERAESRKSSTEESKSLM